MQSKLKQDSLPLSQLRILIIVVIIVGVLFRFINLDGKVYWYDEALSSLRVTGHTQTEYIQEIFNGEIHSIADVQRYQHLEPDKDISDTLRALAGNSEHPPLYYITARLWIEWFGDSITVMRSLSALFSLLVFPCAYWLSRELFGSSLVTWIMLALLAVSPFHVLYAQEAREYSLWTATILLSSAALLQATRRKTISSWVVYSLTLALGLYSFLFSAFVMIGHGLYTLVSQKFQLNRTTLNYLLSSLAGIILFLPWILVMFSGLDTVEKTTVSARKDLDFVSFAKDFLINLGRIFIDLEIGTYSVPFVAILVAYSLYFLSKKTEKNCRLFILILAGLTVTIVALIDLIFGWQLSTRGRYLIPSYLGVQIAVSYLLATRLVTRRIIQQRVWSFITVLLISGGVMSCILISQADAWWTKGSSHFNPAIAEIINRSSNPLLVSNTYELNPGQLLSLSHLLQDKVRVLLTKDSEISQMAVIPSDGVDVFVFNPSRRLRLALEKTYIFTETHDRVSLWKLEANN
jgi:uncharacterized membrane protein